MELVLALLLVVIVVIVFYYITKDSEKPTVKQTQKGDKGLVCEVTCHGLSNLMIFLNYFA